MRRPGTGTGRTLAALLSLALLVGVGLGAAQPAVAGPSGGEGEKNSVPNPIDLNRADEQELTAVPGIGKVIAARIVKFRDEHGPFRRVEDLMKVKGIGEKSFEKIRPHVIVGAKG